MVLPTEGLVAALCPQWLQTYIISHLSGPPQVTVVACVSDLEQKPIMTSRFVRREIIREIGNGLNHEAV